ATGGLFLRRALFLYKLTSTGKPVARTENVPTRAGREVTEVLGQKKLLQRLGPGLMHAFIFWGFLVLLTTIIEAIGLVLFDDFALPFVGRSGWLGLGQDVFMFLVIVGIYMALFFRKVRREDRFIGSHTEEADFVLLMILGIMLTLLGLNAVAVAQHASDSPAAWMPISGLVSAVVFDQMSAGWLDFFFQLFLWSHIVIILAFLVYVPYSKHLHVFTSSINVFFGTTRKRGRLEPLRIDMDNLTEDSSLGAATITDLSWKQMLDTMTCTECGRCQDVCPAWNTGKELSPKLLVMNLRDHLFEEGPKVLAADKAAKAASGGGEAATLTYEPVQLNPGIIEDRVLWDCTTCGACMQECPVDIEHIDHIVDMRRNLVMAESRFPTEVGTLLRNLETTNNPWGLPQSTRADWAEGLGVRILEPGQSSPEYLYWAGCAGSFDDRAKAISTSVV
ncbi:MAG: 4Fe-4S dicluster domain-containing protein, partial [Actinomycetota bacterium]